jgi:phospholipase C
MRMFDARWEAAEQRQIKRRIGKESPVDLASRSRPDLPVGTDLLPEIKHIVVLMMENHSYDNYLGMLAGRGEGFARDVSGAPLAANPRHDGTMVRAHHLASTVQVERVPTQTWNISHLQFDDGRNDGFVTSIEDFVPGADPTVPMGYWTEQDLPFYYGLARAFPLADHWFCSCLGPTLPNRRFMIAGTAYGLIDDLPWNLADYPKAGTIFDLLTRNGIGWANYHNANPTGLLLKRLLGNPGLIAARRLPQVGRLFPSVVVTVAGNIFFTAGVYPLGLASYVRHLRTTKQFFADADAGTLPPFSIVDPNFNDFSEENPQDIRKGESFASEVITRVMHGKGWPNTLLIWTYDEHGGYYDHVAPPAAVPPDDVLAKDLVLAWPSWVRALLKPLLGSALTELQNADAGPRTYDQYGFRVPAVIVSPYAKPGHVTSTVYDHTSILKLVEQKWNLPALTRRDAAANSPLDALDLQAEPAFLKPPQLPAPSLPWSAVLK